MTTPEEEIRRLIRREGPIPFARFMETALYHPHGGYYATAEPFGRGGDFYTSPQVHPAFGALLALQLRRMWELLGQPDPFVAAEPGAGQGRLARDVATYARRLGGPFYRALRYVALERYPPAPPPPPDHYPLPWLPGDLPVDPSDGPLRLVVAHGLPLRDVEGVVLFNELLDSLPVHRFQIVGGEVREIYVGLEGDRFVEVLGPPSTPALAERLSALGRPLPEGFRGEVNLELGPWFAQVSAALRRGFVVAIDYGHEEAELYSDRRARGTLRTHYRHTAGDDPYRRVGRQDVTAHVDFTWALRQAQRHGLRPLALLSQAEYLERLGLPALVRSIRQADLPPSHLHAQLSALGELVREDGLGGFKVLLLEKDTGVDRADDLFPRARELEALPPALATPQHLRPASGGYPQETWELPHLWPPGR